MASLDPGEAPRLALPATAAPVQIDPPEVSRSEFWASYKVAPVRGDRVDGIFAGYGYCLNTVRAATLELFARRGEGAPVPNQRQRAGADAFLATKAFSSSLAAVVAGKVAQ